MPSPKSAFFLVISWHSGATNLRRWKTFLPDVKLFYIAIKDRSLLVPRAGGAAAFGVRPPDIDDGGSVGPRQSSDPSSSQQLHREQHRTVRRLAFNRLR